MIHGTPRNAVHHIVHSTAHGPLACAVLCIGLAAAGCASAPDYEAIVERELARGVAVNELFLGYELGMSKQGFYDHSWELNSRGLVMQGPRNLTVQYELEDVLPHPAKMFYYPDFYDEKVFQMRVRFLYDGWAPWNTDLWSDSLQVHVIDLMEEWYGAGFFEYAKTQESFGENVSYVNVDGTRRIVVARDSDSEVVVVFTDLLAERKIEQDQARVSR